MQPFVLNRHGRIVLPSNFQPSLDFSVLHSRKQFVEFIRRDFETKASTASEIAERVTGGGYSDRFELMRDVALNLFWANRFTISTYNQYPARWADVPRTRDDVYLPVLASWQDSDFHAGVVRAGYDALPAAWDGEVEDRIFRMLFDIFGHRPHSAMELRPVAPTVAEALSDAAAVTLRLAHFDPDFPLYTEHDMIDCREDVPELEALHRWAMVLHNQHPWDRAQAQLAEIGSLSDDDVVVVLRPRDLEVQRFIARTREESAPIAPPTAVSEPRRPRAPYPAVRVPAHFRVQPRLEALAVARGEHVCTNDDLVRNTAYNWSSMRAEDIARKTGIEQRRYTSRPLEQLALDAARAALRHADRGAEDIGAVLFCSCTGTRPVPSVAAWLSGELGIYQTHNSSDIIAACAALPYGLAEATRLLQEVERPVLLVCAEKFSDKIGNVRTSRMIFGDGAAAIVIGVAPAGTAGDIEYLQTYAGGPVNEVNSIIWPNPDFDNNFTVYGPDVKSLAGRYLRQMINELIALPDPAGSRASLFETIDLIVPHQANKTMVIDLAAQAGIGANQLYFNVDRVGNLSAASIPTAIADAVADKTITDPVRIFAPGFGAGAVGGYSVMRLDPSIVAPETVPNAGAALTRTPRRQAPTALRH